MRRFARTSQRVLNLVVDLALWQLAGFLAFALRLEPAELQDYLSMIGLYLAIGFIIKPVLLYTFRLSQQSWQNVSTADLLALLKVVGLHTLIMLSLSFLSNLAMPRSIAIIEASLALLLMGGARFIGRILQEHSLKHTDDTRNVLILGAGDAGTFIARSLISHNSSLKPLGFLDDDPKKQDRSFMGLPILGTLKDFPKLLQNQAVDEVIIAMSSAPEQVVRQIINVANHHKVACKMLPDIQDLLSGKVAINQLREINISSLLTREPVSLNLDAISSYLSHKIIMVTGAGGSIGSELIRQILRFNPKQILLLGRGEYSIYTIEQELKRNWPELDYRCLICDVRDEGKLEHIFKTYQPQVIFHAAAHKHVPLMEEHPDEAILNNIKGTRNLTRLALAYKTECFVNISTDKAVNPTSVMGTTKRIAELLVADAALQAKRKQTFVSVRFGNVLGSRGSVVPLFQQQILAGGPVTVTDPNMTRYFMTIPEASQLVLQAGSIGQNGHVYILDMGEPVNIADLASNIIKLSGYEPNQDIDIVFTGPRPGEKLYEELLTPEEGNMATQHQRIFSAKIDLPQEQLLQYQVDQLIRLAGYYNPQSIKTALNGLIPQYTHVIKGQNQDNSTMVAGVNS